MVNLNFIHLVFNKPDWVDDITAVKISKRVTKKDMEIGDILEQSDKHVIYKLLTKEQFKNTYVIDTFEIDDVKDFAYTVWDSDIAKEVMKCFRGRRKKAK